MHSNPLSRALPADANLRAVIADRGLIAAMQKAVAPESTLQGTFTDAVVLRALESKSFRELVEQNKVAAIVADAELRAMIGGAAFEALLNSAIFRQAFGNSVVRAALKNPAFGRRLAEH